MNEGKPVIGLTGPTGAGKSTVAAALKDLGCAVIDADQIAREAVEQPDCLDALRAAFGADIAGPDGTLNRRLLAERAFASPEKTLLLNGITHPAILRESVRQLEEAKKSPAVAVVFDVPLLFESAADSLCDTTVAVLAPEKTRLKRIMARDQITPEEAARRMQAQHGDEYFTEKAKYIFDGSIDRRDFEGEVRALLERILRETHEGIQ